MIITFQSLGSVPEGRRLIFSGLKEKEEGPDSLDVAREIRAKPRREPKITIDKMERIRSLESKAPYFIS